MDWKHRKRKPRPSSRTHPTPVDLLQASLYLRDLEVADGWRTDEHNPSNEDESNTEEAPRRGA